MIVLKDSALINRDQVTRALLRSDEADVLNEEVLTDSGDFSDHGFEAIHAVSDMIQEHLDRTLMVQVHQEYLAPRDWCWTDRSPADVHYRWFATEWPVVQVLNPGDRTVEIGFDTLRVFSDDTDWTKIKYIAGYRRADQSALGDLPPDVETEINNIADVPVVPDAIREVAVNLVIHRLSQELAGLIGMSQTERSQGDFEINVTRTSIDTEYERRQMRKLVSYANLN